MKIRRVVSLTMFLCFIAMGYTGVMLFLCPQGRVAYWTGWRLFGLSKVQYGELHTTFMLMFLVAGVWHVVLNWGPVKTYLKSRAKRLVVFTGEFNVALVVVLAFAMGTLVGVAPWSSFIGAGESIKNYWERRDGSPPWGHAEENTLARFTRGLVDWERVEHERHVSLSVERAVTALRRAGYDVEDEKQKLIDIAEANDTTPQRLMMVLRDAETPADGEKQTEAEQAAGEGEFPKPYSGLGRMSLREYCAKYELDLSDVLSLFPEGTSVNPDRTLREIAGVLGTDPEGVIDMLNGRSSNRRR
jgi:hypothetical protein